MWYSRDGSLLPSIFMLTCALLVTSSNSEGHGIPISKCGRYPVRERHAAAARNAVARVELYVPGKRIKRTKPPSGCTFCRVTPSLRGPKCARMRLIIVYTPEYSFF